MKKIIYDQLYEYLENFLSKLLCGFRIAHSTQHALLRIIHKWQADLDSGVMLVQRKKKKTGAGEKGI